MRTIFLIIIAIFILNFSFAYAAEVWSLPEKGLKLVGEEKQNYISEKIKRIFKESEPKFEIPDGWNFGKFEVDGVACEFLENPSAKSDRIVYFLHGGGYILGLNNWYRNFLVKASIIANAKKIYVADYRLAPQNIFPTALEDSAKIYKEILHRENNSEKIIFFGDSAGGNLALALSLYLKENKISQPNCLVLVSPWTTMEHKFPSRKYNDERDLVMGKSSAFNKDVKNPAYAKGLDKKNPLLSPIYADLKNFPPMLIQVGSYEIFLDECIELAKKAAADDVKVTLSIYPEMQHDFVIDYFIELQEGVDALKEIRDFINMSIND